jgi:hypothetical protein
MAKIKSTDAETTKPIPSVVETKPSETPSIGVQDIVSLLNLVDVASRRGAYHASEMSSVGAVFDKIYNFMKATGAISTEKTNESTSENKE